MQAYILRQPKSERIYVELFLWGEGISSTRYQKAERMSVAPSEQTEKSWGLSSKTVLIVSGLHECLVGRISVLKAVFFS